MDILSPSAKMTISKIDLIAIASAVVTVLFAGICIASDEPVEKKWTPPSGSMMSSKQIDHVTVMTNLIGDSWEYVSNDNSVYCKRLNESISVDELKELTGFNDTDLALPKNQKSEENLEFDEYFKTCNYISPYRSSWFNFGKDENKIVEWTETDAYIDTEYSLLLIDYLDEEKTTARALFVYKEYQDVANKQEKRTVWHDLKLIWDALIN